MDQSAADQTITQPVRLNEYRPPAFLVSSVDLAFDLDPAATKVLSRLALRRNPKAGPNEPLHLNGEALTLMRLARDGVTLPPDAYRVEDGVLTIDAMPEQCMLEIETRTAPAENTELSGMYTCPGAVISPSARRKDFAASRISRPSRCDVPLHRYHHRRKGPPSP